MVQFSRGDGLVEKHCRNHDAGSDQSLNQSEASKAGHITEPVYYYIFECALCITPSLQATPSLRCTAETVAFTLAHRTTGSLFLLVHGSMHYNMARRSIELDLAVET